MVGFLNPPTVHPPVGAYSHTSTVPAGTELVFVSGQVGVRVDGSIPATLAEQADAVFENLRECLAAHGLGLETVAKLNTFVVAGQDLQPVREARQRFFGSHLPASTLLIVAGLARSGLLLEVEAVAAKAVP